MNNGPCTVTELLRGPQSLPIGFGTWAIGERDWGPMTSAEAKTLLVAAWEVGFRHFDTAEAYGNGRSELLIGQALKSHIRRSRESVSIATKTVVRPPAAMEAHIERSLRRCNCEYFDIFYIHWPREGIDLVRAAEAIDRQRRRGLVRGIGLCNVSIEEARRVARVVPVAAIQFGYNVIWRRAERDGLANPDAVARSPEERVRPVRIAYSPLAQGLLARSFSRAPVWHAEDHRPRTPLFAADQWGAVARFNESYLAVCAEAAVHPVAAALLWLVSGPGPRRVDGAVVGGRTVEQLRALAAGLESALDRPDTLAEVLSRVQTLSDEVQHSLPNLPNMFGYTPTPCRSRGM